MGVGVSDIEGIQVGGQGLGQVFMGSSLGPEPGRLPWRMVQTTIITVRVLRSPVGFKIAGILGRTVN